MQTDLQLGWNTWKPEIGHDETHGIARHSWLVLICSSGSKLISLDFEGLMWGLVINSGKSCCGSGLLVTLHLPGVFFPGGTLTRPILQPLELVYMEQKPQLYSEITRQLKSVSSTCFCEPCSGKMGLGFAIARALQAWDSICRRGGVLRIQGWFWGSFLPTACAKVEKRHSNNSEHGSSLPSSALSEHHPCLGQSWHDTTEGAAGFVGGRAYYPKLARCDIELGKGRHRAWEKTLARL